MVYYKNGLSKLVLPSCDESAMCICSQHWNKTFDNKKKPHSERFSYSYFFTCSIYSTILKCNILEYSFRRSFMKRHDYFVYSLKRCLYHASSLSCTHRIFLTAGRRGEKKRRLKNSSDIVCEYLQTCTDTNLLNDKEYFKEKHFEFKRYELLGVASNNALESVDPLFYSKIPLHRLSTFLNMTELREMGTLHKIPVPYNITKKTMLAYFCDHHCAQCDLYVSVLAENMPKKRVGSKKKENFDLPFEFPPDPPSNALLEAIIGGFCNDTAPHNFIEGSCAVCGRLSPIDNMVLLNEM